jgi:ATP-dependent RNA helicase DeaD
MSTFSSLGLSRPLLEAVEELGFQTPTPVQAQAIPYLLQQSGDFIGLAQTGTGKTAAFGLPMLQLIDTFQHHTQGLIIAPTRELCVQIAEEIRRFALRFPAFRMAVVYGGADIRRQMKDVAAGAQVIVATPGRLRDLIERKAVQLNKVDILVLDEADEMLNMGFKEEIDDILQHTPPTRHTWLFSATMPPGVRRIAQEYMEAPYELTIGGKQSGNPDIEHLYVMVKPDERYPVLRRFLDYDPATFGLIFCRTRQETQDMADQLTRDGYDADALHGDLNQTQRDRVMQRFRARRLKLLVATDVAARGIDVQDITHVFHFNIPDDWSFYTHRSGRTGRAGSKGISIIIARTRDKSLLQQLDQRLKLNLHRTEIPSDRDIVTMRLKGRFHTLATTQPHPGLDKLLSDLDEELKDLSREDIIARLATLAGQALLKKYPNLDAPPPEATREREREREPQGERAGGRRSVSEKDMVRLFINVGRMDMHGVGQFLEFLQHHADINREDVGPVDLHQKHTYFYLNKRQVSKLSQKLAKAELHGRPLRVNHDEKQREQESTQYASKKSVKAPKGIKKKFKKA